MSKVELANDAGRWRLTLNDPDRRNCIDQAMCEELGDAVKIVAAEPMQGEPVQGLRSLDDGFIPPIIDISLLDRKIFVTNHDAILWTKKLLDDLPPPVPRTDLAQPWNILITGVGGTGVVTIGALLGMAGHLEGKGATVLDQTGLAQKGGAVTTHVRIARAPDDIHAVRIAAGEADLVLGCDMVVVNDYWALSKVRPERSEVVLNTYEAMPGSFTTRPDLQFPAAEIIAGVRVALGGREPQLLDATQLATALLGDAIASNLFMLGHAWQQGLVPVSFEALMRAIELNGAAVAMNQQAFAWGRLAAIDL